MTSAPVADQHRLLEVQALDTKAAQLAHQRATHPARAAVDTTAARATTLQEQVVEARTLVGDTRRELSKAEADVEQVRSRAQRDQARVDSGAVSVKDVQAISSELESLAKRQAHLEDVELEIMERLEAQEAVLAEVSAEHAAAAAVHADAGAELARVLADLDAQTAQVVTDRAQRVEGLDASLVALYHKVRDRSGGVGVAVLRGHRCEGCRLELNSSELSQILATPPDQVVRCDECGRILVRGVS